ncbi:hypothetical protein RHCRD62_20528 [Rhodococcus sp. RD6.2]|nr:hypothetical protein RHCRD62_20528 [Rhodococcus sp. RD6.2]
MVDAGGEGAGQFRSRRRRRGGHPVRRPLPAAAGEPDPGGHRDQRRSGPGRGGTAGPLTALDSGTAAGIVLNGSVAQIAGSRPEDEQ